jgi:erythromycin esterase
VNIRSLFLVLMTAWPALSSAQSHAERRSWLASNVAPVRSLDFSDTNYADLAAIGRAIGNRRVVLLGEQGHGDGTTFEAKARVIRYLHEKLGFDLLVFESGFYDCHRTWQDVRAGLSLADSAANCMFELWSNSRQLRPLLEYVDAKKSTNRPVELAGMDFQPSGRRAQLLMADLERFLAAQRDTTGTASIVRALGTSFGYLTAPATRPRNVAPATADSLREATRTAVRQFATLSLRDAPNLGALGEAEFWRRTVSGMGALIEFMNAMMEAKPGTLPPASIMNSRDSVMGDNLAWLAKRNPKRRIVVWGATSHFVRNRTGIEGDPAPRMVPAGHVASERLPNDVYTIAFMGAEGEQGTARRGAAAPTAIPPADSSTLDGLMRDAGIEKGFLDLRSIPRGGEWLRSPLTARPLGYGAMRTVWPNHIDAIFFMRRMAPSTPVVTGPSR